MKTWKNPNIEKDKWPKGKWHKEVDKAQWLDEKTKLNCLMVRNPTRGFWCGYVGIHEGHKLFGVPYGQTPHFDVHGGLTFSESCVEDEEEYAGICHIALDDEPKVWWLGFDCGHAFDVTPGFMAMCSFADCSYRDFEYVKKQCGALAEQIGI